MPTNDEISKNRIELNATRDNFNSFMEFINSNLSVNGIEEEEKTKILTACEEVIVNIIDYAYTESEGSLDIEYENTPNKITITFIDNGKAFNPLEKEDTDINLPLEEREIGGLGILMVKNLMDDVQYDYKNGKNYLSIIKYIS